MKNKSVPEQTAAQVVSEAIDLIDDHLAMGVKNKAIAMMLSSMFRSRRLDRIMADYEHSELLVEMRYRLKIISKYDHVPNWQIHSLRSSLEFAQEHDAVVDLPPVDVAAD